ncbi:hypothetical protein Tco_0898655 [Tanacetum coccineum]
MPGRSAVEAIHLIRSLMEKYRERQRDLHMAFLDLEKAYDSVLRELIWKTLVNKGTSRRYIKGLHHGSAISLYLFALILDGNLGSPTTKKWIYVLGTRFYNLRSLFDILDRCCTNPGGLMKTVEVAELRMLRWTCGKTLLDMILNGVYRAQLEVETIINKMREGRLRWFRHVRRRPQSAPVRRVKDLVVDGSRRRGRPKLRWVDRIKKDMKELLLSEDMTFNRNEWRARIILIVRESLLFPAFVFEIASYYVNPPVFALVRCLCASVVACPFCCCFYVYKFYLVPLCAFCSFAFVLPPRFVGCLLFVLACSFLALPATVSVCLLCALRFATRYGRKFTKELDGISSYVSSAMGQISKTYFDR